MSSLSSWRCHALLLVASGTEIGINCLPLVSPTFFLSEEKISLLLFFVGISSHESADPSPKIVDHAKYQRCLLRPILLFEKNILNKKHGDPDKLENDTGKSTMKQRRDR